MPKLIAGKEYYVSDISEERAIANGTKREFACYDGLRRAYFHQPTIKDLAIYEFAVEIPEPTIEPWTKETFPVGEQVWVRLKSAVSYVILLSRLDINNGGVLVYGDFISYKQLESEFERVMPGYVIVPCGVVK